MPIANGMRAQARRALAVATLAGALVLPLLVDDPYYQGLLNVCLIFILLTLGFNFTFGYTGQISLGHIGFWGIGAYATALLTTKVGWGPVPAAAAGIALAVVLAAPLGLVTRHLEGHYLALATLAFGVIVQLMMLHWVALTGGPNGIGGIPRAGIGNVTAADASQLYYVLLAFVVAGALLAWRWQIGRYGRRSVAVRTGELASQSLGVRTGRVKLVALMISAAFAAVAGSLYAHQTTYVSPDVFGADAMFKVLTMLVIGGAGTVSGAIIGAAALVFLPEWFRGFNQYWQLVYGVLLLVMILRMPYGVSGMVIRLLTRGRQRRRLAPADPAPAVPERVGSGGA